MSSSYRECNSTFANSAAYGNFTDSTCDGFYNPCNTECYLWDDGYRNEDFSSLWIEPHATVIYGKIYPLFVALTAITTVFVAIVLTKKHMQNPTNTILLYMATADLCVVVVSFPFLAMFFVLQYNHHIDQIQTWWCYMAHYSATDVLPPLCHNVAIWLTVLLTAQRLIYVQLPLRAAQICTIRNVNKSALIIVFSALICNIPRFIDVESYRVVNFRLRSAYDNRSIIAEGHWCIYRYTDAVRKISEQYYFMGYYWIRVTLFVIVPSILISILSIGLIVSIKRAKRRRYRVLPQRRRHTISHTGIDHTTVMLIVVAALFLAVNLPQGLILTVFIIQQTFFQDDPFINHRYMAIAMMVDNVLIVATYPINFAIYCFMSSDFRKTFRSLFAAGATVENSSTRSTYQETGQLFTHYGSAVLLASSMAGIKARPVVDGVAKL